MGYPVESDFEYSCDIVSEYICHKYVGVVSVTGSETQGNIADDIQIALEQPQSCIESIYLKLFLLLSGDLSEKCLVNQLKVRSLHDISNLTQIKLHLLRLIFVFGLN